MKKLLLGLACFLMMIGCFGFTVFSEETTGTNSDYEYNISNEQVTITKYIGSGGEVIIPSEIDGYQVASIAPASFLNCDSITAITIPNGVKSIRGVFQQCKNLTHVTLSNSITDIDSAFIGCSSLAEINIPKDVISIGNYAFYGCTKLVEVNIPEKISYIGDYAFYGCSNLIKIHIPEGITGIGTEAFYGCSSLTEVNIPKSVAYIGGFVFNNCTNLQTVYYNAKNCKSVEQFQYGNRLFENCHMLNTVIIGTEVENILASMFYNCNSIINLIIPPSVTNIGDYAFYGCTKLTEVNIPESIAYIGYRAFAECSNLMEVNIPENTELEDNIFENCTNLQTVYYNTITTDKFQQFNGCKNISKIIFGEQVQVIPFFKDCLIREIIIPESINYISREAFSNCKNLQTVFFNAKNCEYPGSWSNGDSYFSPFRGCMNISKVILGDNVQTIPSGLFGDYNNDFTFTDIIIPEGITSIGEGAFYSCDLTDIAIPSSVKSIGASAFDNCANLTNVTFAEGVTTIGEAAFAYCGFTNITIPESVTSIGKEAFRCCPITNIVIPQNVTSIGEGTFTNCIYLENINVEENNSEYISIDGVLFNKEMTELIQYPASKRQMEYNIPNGVTNIGSSAFMNSKLTSITIPNSITDIGSEAFSICDHLTTITIPDSVTSIGSYAFRNCNQLTDIIVAENNPSYISVDGILFNKDKTKLLQYPDGKEQTVYIIPDGVTNISSGAFSCNKLLSIALPDGITTFDVFTFRACGNLTSIAVPDSVTYMEDGMDWVFNDNTTIYSTADAYAHQYAIDNNLKWADISTVVIYYSCNTTTKKDIILEGKEDVTNETL